MIDLERRSSRDRLLTLSLTALLAFSLQSCAHAPRPMSASAEMYTAGVASMIMNVDGATAAPEFDRSVPPPPPPPPPPPVESAEPHFTDSQPVHAAAAHRPSAAAAGPTFAEAAAPAEGPPAEDRALCDVTGKFLSTTVCNELRTLKATAKMGLQKVDFPDSMMRGETRKVVLVIHRAAVGEALPSAPVTTATTDTTTLLITGTMGAVLEGEGFKIDPPDMKRKDIGISDNARWSWDVTPLKAPHHKLTLTTYMVYEAADGSESVSPILPSAVRDIPVKVTVSQSVSDFVASLVSISDSAKLLIGAFTALLVALLTFKAKVAELIGPFFGRKTSPPQQQQG